MGKWITCLTLTFHVIVPLKSVHADLLINLNPTAGMSQESIDGFQRAADYWQSVLTDDVTINLDIDFTTLDPGILGSAGSTTQLAEVSDYYNALGNDATSADDAQAVANLSTLNNGLYAQFRTQVDTENGSTAISLDNDQTIATGGANNRFLNINTANAKAVGLFTGDANASDADITFSDRFSWDFDNSDGIGAGLQDFVGVAIHEIGHALGFTSGVDTVNFAIDNSLDLEGFRVFTGLDMFRYSAADGILDLSVGTDSYFSLDGGATNLGLFSTGTTVANGGDGQQASHWKDGLGLGILDPTAQPAGVLNVVTELDLQALDVIGWNRNLGAAVPEPSSIGLMGVLGFVFYMRKRVPRQPAT